MKRWNCSANAYIESKSADDFLEEVVSVCRKHGISIGHEDNQGGFEIWPFNESDAEWLMGAFDQRIKLEMSVNEVEVLGGD